MKKILGISLVAVLTAMPLMAGAATGDAVNAVPTADANGPTTVAPKYATVADIAADETSLATAKYVKGAYNAAIKAINTVDTNYKAADTAINDKIGNTTLTTTSQTLTGAIEEIKSANATTAGAGIDKTDGKFSVDLATNSGLETSGEGDAAKLQIADGGVTATKLASDSVTTAKIADGAVTTDQLGANAVTTAKIANGAVTTDQLGAKAVTTAKIDDQAVTAAQIANNTITTTQVATGSMSTGTANNDKLTTQGYVDDAISGLNIGDYATKAQVTANIDAATASVDVTGTALSVAGNVTGTVPAMVSWGDQTAGSVDLANGTIGTAYATGTISGIDVAAPSSYQPGAGE